MRKRYRRLPPKQTSGNDTFIKPSIQRKLKVGKTGDAYEVEADAVADKVVNNSEASQTVQKTESSEEEVQQKPFANSVSVVQREGLIEKEPVQRVEEEEESVQQQEDEKLVQTMEEEPDVQQMEEEETVQAKFNKKSGASLENRLKQCAGGGNKMDAKTRQKMETRFGADFSKIRIHTDNNATQMSKELGAQAFTNGEDIYFNEGKYNPNAKEGQHLLAHELTHTIQQKGEKIKSKTQESEDSIK